MRCLNGKRNCKSLILEIIFLFVFLVVILLWIIRFKNLFSIKDKKKYEESRDSLIDELLYSCFLSFFFLILIMSKQALKFQLHQFIDTIEDEETLLVLNESFNSIKKDSDILDELSSFQQTRLQTSIQQAKDGKVVSNKSVKNHIQVLLTK